VTRGPSERPAPKAPPPGAGRARTATELDAREDVSTGEGLSLEEVEVLLHVGDMLRRVRFGTVMLVVQDGKVVQIETAEKFRL
jgi:hypothetical protein